MFALAALVFTFGITISSHADYGITRLPWSGTSWCKITPAR
jgi:hypothetical protein